MSSSASQSEQHRVQLFAAYIPQGHATLLNEYWAGCGYTDWDAVCNSVIDGGKNRLHEAIRTPLPPPNGLGWYDLRDMTTRRRQALLAKEYGIHGFAIYHYWLSSRPSKLDGRTTRPAWLSSNRSSDADMDQTLLQLLDESDGEPNLPFYFVWANEPFVWRWEEWRSESDNSRAPRAAVLMPGQSYPRWGWRTHFDYLLRFFKHRNYHRIDGKPVFAVHFVAGLERRQRQQMIEMMAFFRKWAIMAGLPGLHLLQMSHSHTQRGVVERWQLAKWADGLQDFGRTILAHGSEGPETEATRPAWLPPRIGWHGGLYVHFDNTPRVELERSVIRSPDVGEAGLEARLDRALGLARNESKSSMVLVNAWNEWSEGAALEPSEQRGFANLEAVRAALMRHGQYSFRDKPGLWRSTPKARYAQLTTCSGGKARKRQDCSAQPPRLSGLLVYVVIAVAVVAAVMLTVRRLCRAGQVVGN
jgi:hypothetical protein